MSERKSLSFGKQELQEALIEYAARHLGVPFPLRHEIEVHGQIMATGESICTVTLEHIENVVVLSTRTR